MTTERPSLQSLVLVPALVTLAVTLLRLVGELQNWSPVLFARQAGGAGAIIGIVWLVLIFGFYFGLRLARAGATPAPGGVIGQGLLGLALLVVPLVLASRAKVDRNLIFFGAIVLSLVAAWLAWRAWPAMGRVLLAYGFAARIPVILVMLVAIYANWGTHYDVLPPNSQFPPVGPLVRWIMIGVVPQLLLWIPFTIYAGMVCAGIALAVVGREPR